MNFCEFPILLNGKNWECGDPACTKVRGHWFCVSHEDLAYNLKSADIVDEFGYVEAGDIE